MSPFDPSDPIGVFFALVVVHALADFPLQGEYLARQKTRATADGTGEWIVALGAHSIIHAGGVWLVTGSKTLGLVELCVHTLIDLLKGKRFFGTLADQSLHLVCKLIYCVWIIRIGL